MRITPILSIIVIILTVSSCAPVMVAGTATSVSAVYDQRNLTTIYQDEGIAHQIYGLINTDNVLKDAHLNVVSINSSVLVVGQVPTLEDKKRTSDLIHSISEVKKIYNQTTVGPMTSALVKSNDLWITTKVKAAMLAENGLPSTQVKVLTENNVVYLLGVVDKQHADLAVGVASKIKGVKKVVKLFQDKAPNNQQKLQEQSQ